MRQINRNILLNAVGNTAYNGLQWLITVIVTRYSGLGAAGILSAAMSVSLMFRSVTYFGIRNYYVSDQSAAYSDGDYTALRIVTASVGMLSCMIFTLFCGYDKTTLAAIFYFMIYRTAEGFSDHFGGIFQKNDRLDIAGIFLLIKSVMTAVFFFAGYFAVSLNFGIMLMALSSVIFLAAAEMPFASKMSAGTVPSFTKLTELVRNAFPMFIYQLEVSAVFNSPKIILLLMCGKEEAGAYSSFFSLALIVQAVSQYCYTPFTAKFAELFACGKKHAFQRSVLFVITAMFFFMSAFFMLAVFFGEKITSLLFGEDILMYRQMIIPSVIGACAYSLSCFGGILLTVMRKIHTLMTAQTASAVLSVISTIVFVGIYGANGAAYGTILSSSAAMALMICSIFRYNKPK